MRDWQTYLEVAGAEFFQRYRKRLLLPGVTLEIRDELPNLTLPDVMVRVHAGRQIIRNGDDFRVLRAIRNGRWPRPPGVPGGSGVFVSDQRSDRVSRLLVGVGGALFAVFCLLSLFAAMAAGNAAWLIVVSVLMFALILPGMCQSVRLHKSCDSGATGCRKGPRIPPDADSRRDD